MTEGCLILCSSFGLHNSFDIRHSDFVIHFTAFSVMSRSPRQTPSLRRLN